MHKTNLSPRCSYLTVYVQPPIVGVSAHNKYLSMPVLFSHVSCIKPHKALLLILSFFKQLNTDSKVLYMNQAHHETIKLESYQDDETLNNVYQEKT